MSLGCVSGDERTSLIDSKECKQIHMSKVEGRSNLL